MGRTPCCDKNGLKKGPWTSEEDTKLIQYIQIHGPGNWRTLPKNCGLERCGKSCRLRWTNYLRPDIKRGRFSFEEEEAIIQLHSVLGNKWSVIATKLPGRTDNEIKNYWNTHIRKRLLRMGIDPVTHAPRLDLVDLSSLVNSPDQFHLSTLLRLQALVNPDALRLAATLLASNKENPLHFLQKLQENQLLNAQLQNHASKFQSNEFENGFDQQIPLCNQANLPASSSFPQSNLMQMMQTNHQTYQDPSSNFGYADSGQIRNDLLESSSFQSLNSGGSSSNNSQNISLSSLLSTPDVLNSASSTLISGGMEEERESSFSDFLKFEIPESLDFDDFM